MTATVCCSMPVSRPVRHTSQHRLKRCSHRWPSRVHLEGYDGDRGSWRLIAPTMPNASGTGYGCEASVRSFYRNGAVGSGNAVAQLRSFGITISFVARYDAVRCIDSPYVMQHA